MRKCSAVSASGKQHREETPCGYPCMPRERGQERGKDIK
jgi:hypothetical protein